MSEQIITARDSAAAWAKAAIGQLWLSVNPYDDAQVREFTVKAAGLLSSAQTAATRVAAAGQSQQLAALGIRITGTPSNPVDVRAPGASLRKGQLQLHRHAVTVDYAAVDGVKVSAADMTTESVLQRPAALFRYVQSQDGLDAAQQASQRLDSLIDDNLMLAQRLAQQQVLAQAVNLDGGGQRGRNRVKITGYRRVIHPELSRGGTCGMCIAASDRIYKIAELMPIHAHCKCTIAAVTEDYDPADDLNAVDLNALYKDAGGTSVAHLKRTRYQVDEHGELGPVLVPQKKYRPRTAQSVKKAGGTGIDPGAKPESKADIAARHLPLLKKSLEDLRARGLAEDSPQVTYHLAQIAKFEAELAK
ncbi:MULTISPECIES: hypothetical protein [unclassified Mycobacterium]|uniref:hypothetical protein n=1 Tax=unclassified Mycobacterium TaxID=2642494 RepID=UPI0027414124|nr:MULTISPECIES: hypothetical protein [unclassified Mycobacterium]MDP7703189.1 hypothetical protein [Mycobacterium sp. TY815]MDP7721794.1 hypothetical protein [Mycobacterium sp. TY814]